MSVNVFDRIKMAEKVRSDQFVGQPIVIFEETDRRRLPGFDQNGLQLYLDIYFLNAP